MTVTCKSHQNSNLAVQKEGWLAGKSVWASQIVNGRHCCSANHKQHLSDNLLWYTELLHCIHVRHTPVADSSPCVQCMYTAHTQPILSTHLAYTWHILTSSKNPNHGERLEEEAEGVCKLGPVNKTSCLCQSWQSCQMFVNLRLSIA